ncbi:uncharacterized protein LOC134654727 [Cydia amplana]|uniref:uncharacterized protein LOC134654727 n=1 Tax=Cydia amplana TaxID=1869771 RepID=UPI002FE54570
MKRGKSPGHDGLSIEHLQHAGVHLPRVLSMLFNLCIRHSYLPASLMRTLVVPIVKNRTGDVSDRNNYRPISLATVTAKVLDGLLNKQLDNYLHLHDAQFGFRAGLSTESAIFTLKETVKYYTQRQTPVYGCFMDLSKAFDMVSYRILWGKLRATGMPKELVDLFSYWYERQENCVRWAGAVSDTYRLECGVRQGGLTSPKLFCLYVDELIAGLSSTYAGCSIDGQMVNNISYADDMVLLSPSVSALGDLLRKCETYADSHGLKYNCLKKQVMVFAVRGRSVDYVPPIKLHDRELEKVDQFKYLGHIITSDLKDDSDIERERRALAVRGNMLARRFAHCTGEVKRTLFKSFCQSFYTSGLWVSYTQRALNALRVLYNNMFRVLMGLPRFCSASGMFADAHVEDFHAVMRKKIVSIRSRIQGSPNSILNMLADRPDSLLQRHWMSALINPHSGEVYYLN